MANYNAVVNLNVVGTSRLERVNAAVGQLNDLTRALNNNMNLLAPGAGKLGDKLRVAFEPIKKFARDASNGVAQFANTVAGASAQTQVFATVLDNVKLKSGGFDNQVAAVKDLANAWAGASINATDYNRRLKELQATTLAKKGMMMLSSGEIALGTEAGVGVQGPRLPRALGGGLNLPEGVSRLAPQGLRTAQGVLTKPGVADAIIGAGFPALFGGGPGAILGGGIGGLAGGALGGPLGMALSVGLSAVGQKLDEAVAKTTALGNALNALSIDKLRESFVYVNAELATTVRRLLEAGEAQKAQQVIAEAAARQTGVLPGVTASITKEANMLGNQWNKFLSAIGGTVSILGAAFIPALRTIIGGLTQILQFSNNIASKIFEWVANGVNKLVERFPFLNNLLGWFRGESEDITEEMQKQVALLAEKTDRLNEEVQLAQRLNELEDDKVSNATFAGQLINAEIDRQKELENLKKEFNDRERQIKTEFAGIDQQTHLDALEALKKEKEAAIDRTSEEKKRILVLKEADSIRSIALQNQTAQLNLQANAVQQQLSLVQAQAQAQTTLNNIEIQSLERLKDGVQSYDTKLRIIDKILKLEIANARIAYESAVAQVKANLQLLKIARVSAIQKAKNLEIDLLSAAAKGEEVTNYKKALLAGKEAVDIATQNLQFGRAIADEQLKVAKATYDAAVQAAKLKAQTSAAATQAEQFAGAMERAAGAAKETAAATKAASYTAVTSAITPTGAGLLKSEEARKAQFSLDVARFGVPTTSQETRGQQMSDFLASLRSREADGQPTSAGPINIQTGPVMQQDGKNYVTLADMQNAMETVASSMFNSSRSAGARRYTGVR